ncbi:cation diffusion facilitator family transporter [Gillisia sp. Hel_I_86]|uniref:cation diffusion facilitator family transporter n=1 Tax=Gillisia sp. Hel_I_86 TaxID=1249981 RepID=UPI00119B4C12|nr:cation diffusion facilitator family transporter [Gillisia sp. Hel_I_86]TVZ28518.1 cation diffusion facilitator family transporter [Gillisia sp. Hel_I_86]
MSRFETFELPDYLKPLLKKAKFLEWLTLLYLLSTIILMYLVMGSSQAMKTAWLEDALSTLPAISFLIATRFHNKTPNVNFPYGYHRVFSIAFLTGALALFGMGCFLAIDSAVSLISQDHPTIGSMMFMGNQIWMGWLMIAALVYSAIPSMILGYKKLPIAKKLHNKILYTDANTQKADYMTAFAAVLGILGVGLGFWWMDATAALFISISVIKDGFINLKDAIKDLMDRRPVHVDDSKPDELVDTIEELVNSWDWVIMANVRFREHGQVYFGEVFVVLAPDLDPSLYLETGIAEIKKLHWKINDITFMPVNSLPTNTG